MSVGIDPKISIDPDQKPSPSIALLISLYLRQDEAPSFRVIGGLIDGSECEHNPTGGRFSCEGIRRFGQPACIDRCSESCSPRNCQRIGHHSFVHTTNRRASCARLHAIDFTSSEASRNGFPGILHFPSFCLHQF